LLLQRCHDEAVANVRAIANRRSNGVHPIANSARAPAAAVCTHAAVSGVG
jgi:hypothetical protein